MTINKRLSNMDNLDYYTNLWHRATALGRRFVGTFDLDKKLRRAQVYASKHPVQTLLVVGALCVLSVPVGFFVMFAAGSIAFTFCGFMFVEGTILAIAGLILGGILLVFSFFAVTLGGFVFVVFYLLNMVWNAFDLTSKLAAAKSKSSRSGVNVSLATRTNNKNTAENFRYIHPRSIDQSSNSKPEVIETGSRKDNDNERFVYKITPNSIASLETDSVSQRERCASGDHDNDTDTNLPSKNAEIEINDFFANEAIDTSTATTTNYSDNQFKRIESTKDLAIPSSESFDTDTTPVQAFDTRPVQVINTSQKPADSASIAVADDFSIKSLNSNSSTSTDTSRSSTLCDAGDHNSTKCDSSASFVVDDMTSYPEKMTSSPEKVTSESGNSITKVNNERILPDSPSGDSGSGSGSGSGSSSFDIIDYNEK